MASPSRSPSAPNLPFDRVEALFIKKRKKSTLPIFVVRVADFDTWKESAPETIQAWLNATRFTARGGACRVLPESSGLAGVVVTVEDPSDPFEFASLVKTVPAGSYEAEPELSSEVGRALCLGWALGGYSFRRYKSNAGPRSRTLVWPEGADSTLVRALAGGIYLARDLVNTPASDMGPEELAAVAKQVAKLHGAKFKVTVGDDLVTQNYPMVHAVGRASNREPRLADLTWGKNKHPKLTLVGKGVCFDTGGLDLKPPQYMKLMKKDMGGAALVLGLAHAIMASGLPVRLRVLVPAVENSVSGNAMRPLDVLSTRKGITVEVGDTDAEGRLILGDALCDADSESPDLIIDAATLTGAARVALGTEMPAVFATQDATWTALEAASRSTHEPLWRLPLHRPYRRNLESKVADICNISGNSYGGAITAALFLNEFVSEDRDWVHVDTMGYNIDHRPGRPPGGEGLGLMALHEAISSRFSSATLPGPSDSVDAPKEEEPVEVRPPTDEATPAKVTKKARGARPSRANTRPSKASPPKAKPSAKKNAGGPRRTARTKKDRKL